MSLCRSWHFAQLRLLPPLLLFSGLPGVVPERFLNLNESVVGRLDQNFWMMLNDEKHQCYGYGWIPGGKQRPDVWKHGGFVKSWWSRVMVGYLHSGNNYRRNRWKGQCVTAVLHGERPFARWHLSTGTIMLYYPSRDYSETFWLRYNSKYQRQQSDLFAEFTRDQRVALNEGRLPSFFRRIELVALVPKSFKLYHGDNSDEILYQLVYHAAVTLIPARIWLTLDEIIFLQADYPTLQTLQSIPRRRLILLPDSNLIRKTPSGLMGSSKQDGFCSENPRDRLIPLSFEAEFPEGQSRPAMLPSTLRSFMVLAQMLATFVAHLLGHPLESHCCGDTQNRECLMARDFRLASAPQPFQSLYLAQCNAKTLHSLVKRLQFQSCFGPIDQPLTHYPNRSEEPRLVDRLNQGLTQYSMERLDRLGGFWPFANWSTLDRSPSLYPGPFYQFADSHQLEQVVEEELFPEGANRSREITLLFYLRNSRPGQTFGWTDLLQLSSAEADQSRRPTVQLWYHCQANNQSLVLTTRSLHYYIPLAAAQQWSFVALRLSQRLHLLQVEQLDEQGRVLRQATGKISPEQQQQNGTGHYWAGVRVNTKSAISQAHLKLRCLWIYFRLLNQDQVAMSREECRRSVLAPDQEPRLNRHPVRPFFGPDSEQLLLFLPFDDRWQFESDMLYDQVQFSGRRYPMLRDPFGQLRAIEWSRSAQANHFYRRYLEEPVILNSFTVFFYGRFRQPGQGNKELVELGHDELMILLDNGELVVRRLSEELARMPLDGVYSEQWFMFFLVYFDQRLFVHVQQGQHIVQHRMLTLSSSRELYFDSVELGRYFSYGDSLRCFTLMDRVLWSDELRQMPCTCYYRGRCPWASRLNRVQDLSQEKVKELYLKADFNIQPILDNLTLPQLTERNVSQTELPVNRSSSVVEQSWEVAGDEQNVSQAERLVNRSSSVVEQTWAVTGDFEERVIESYNSSAFQRQVNLEDQSAAATASAVERLVQSGQTSSSPASTTTVPVGDPVTEQSPSSQTTSAASRPVLLQVIWLIAATTMKFCK